MTVCDQGIFDDIIRGREKIKVFFIGDNPIFKAHWLTSSVRGWLIIT